MEKLELSFTTGWNVQWCICLSIIDLAPVFEWLIKCLVFDYVLVFLSFYNDIIWLLIYVIHKHWRFPSHHSGVWELQGESPRRLECKGGLLWRHCMSCDETKKSLKSLVKTQSLRHRFLLLSHWGWNFRVRNLQRHGNHTLKAFCTQSVCIITIHPL